MTSRYRILLIALLSASLALLLCSACATFEDSPTHVKFVLVRHAEVAPDGTRDPALSEAGLARAHKLAASQTEVIAVYATPYRRTQQTAALVAEYNPARKVRVTTYDANLPAQAFASQLLRSHKDGTVVVVGHSNTIPALAAALLREVPPIHEDEFDRLITFTVSNRVRFLDETRY